MYEPRRLRLTVLSVCLLLLTSSVQAGIQNSLLDLSSDGTRLACTNRDSGTVTILQQSNGQWSKAREIKVGRHPEGVTFIGDSHRIAVAVYGDDEIVLLNADSDQIESRIAVFDEPYSVISTPGGDRLYATLDHPGQILEIDPASAKITREFKAGPGARGLALLPDGQRLMVTEYLTGLVHTMDRTTGKRLKTWTGTPEDNLARQITVHPNRPKAYITHIRSRTLVPQGAGAIFPYVAVLDTEPLSDADRAADAEPRRKRIQMDSFRGTYVVANPWDMSLSPDCKTLAVVFSGTDDLFLCDVLDDDYRELRHRYTLRTGSNPRAIRYTADGQQLLVYNALDFSISVVNPVTGKVQQTVAVTESPLSAEMLLGKKLFYSANQPMVGQKWISCSSCHPDGDADGRTWQQPEGLRQTQPLAGLAWTHPVHWSADRDEVQDFEHTIRGPLMQGRGLIKGKLNDALGEPNSGRSKEADALAVYTNSHTFDLSPYARKTLPDGTRVTGEAGLSDAAKRGRELFFDATTQCATCHKGPYYTDSTPGLLTRHDVGTGNDDPSELMGPTYDTPTLIGLYRSAPYLHHGKAATLEEVLTTENKQDRHGKTSHLSPEQVADLAEFLKALPYTDPLPQGIAAGLKKVEK